MKKILTAMLVAVTAAFATLPAFAVNPVLPARRVAQPVLHAVRGTMVYTDIKTSGLNKTPIGTVPSGSIIVGCTVAVRTGMTAAATCAVSIGTTTSTSSIMTKATLLPEATGMKVGVLSPAVTADTTFYFNETSEATTSLAAGSLEAVIYYYPHSL